MRLVPLVVCGVLVTGGVALAVDSPVDAGAPPVTPLQAEMRELNTAMQVTLLSIANNDLDAITPAIVRVHGARNQTEEALKKNQVKLPRNGDNLAAFIKQDEAFHKELVKLVRAAKAHDVTAATQQLGVVLNGCTACHVKYRFPDAAPPR